MNTLGGVKTTAATDYAYDDNGNLIQDKNKDITDISYNYLNLPAVVSTAKGTITYTYDAAGVKLRKQVVETASTQNGNQQITTTTTYISGFVYEQATKGSTTEPEALQFFAHEEGRVRPTTDVNNPFVFDYFIKDHLGNVRMILTDEQ